MLSATLCTNFLPIILQRATTTKPALFLVLSKEHQGQACINNTGVFDDESFTYFKDGSFCYGTTKPEYASYLDKQFVSSKAEYNPLALLSSGFISESMYSGIATIQVATLEQGSDQKLPSDFNVTSFHKKMMLASILGSEKPQLPAITGIEPTTTTTIDVEPITATTDTEPITATVDTEAE